jgi:ATP-dependent helicase/nuclease subunit A
MADAEAPTNCKMKIANRKLNSTEGVPICNFHFAICNSAFALQNMDAVRNKQTRELKPEQQLAAHTLDRHVAVTAGPGGGKTTVLVERYLHILRTRDISVDQIVAITFTNRAANEMRERLRTELDKLLWSATPNERAKWMRHKRTLEGAIITTIHGFCARLLREFPVEADIDPQFALLDAHQSAMLEEAVVEETLTEFISANHQAITELAAGVGRARLARGLIDIYRSMRNQGLTVEKLQALVETSHGTVEDYRRAVEELSRKIVEFIQTGGLSSSADERRRDAGRLWPALRETLLNAPDSSSLAEFSEAVQRFRDATRPKAQVKIRDLVSELDKLIWKDKLGGLVPQKFFDLHARRYSTELIEVVKTIERRLDDEKRRRSALDFDDLQVRALRLLEDHPEVLRRTSGRYRFFLVDEFQDTNSLQRDLMVRLALGSTDFSLSGGENQHTSDRLKSVARANLFIVGDRKQSIYGFRGADVDVFREMTARIQSRDGLPITLNRNFRSQRPLISWFNFLFEWVFARDGIATVAGELDLNELGYVEHEASIAAREDEDTPPLAELLIDLRKNDTQDEAMNSSRLSPPSIDERVKEKPRERDAEQLAERIISIVGKDSISEGTGSRVVKYRDIALLFRAMTEVHIYEAAFRRKGIPYVTVDGKGFYAREEITDFIQLLRFLDNKTDEVALAAVLRSPICGLSDDTLLALRCPPRQTGAEVSGTASGRRHEPGSRSGVRPLLAALHEHELVASIDQAERPALDRARELLGELIRQAMRSRVSELLRFAVEASEYRIVAAANFDGGQRLANIEKLFTLAERFENSGAYMIRDFVRFVRDFEEAGGRESEGQIDDSADAVRLMSIHQSKGLEFPVVIIPDLHRQPDNRRAWWALDRHRGLTLKVPDGTGKLAAGRSFVEFTERAKLREEFESMRLLYVAATRAQDRLILSGAVKDLASIRSSWLAWISKALAIGKDSASGILAPVEDMSVRLTLNLLDAARKEAAQPIAAQVEEQLSPPADERFPLLDPIEPQRTSGLYRFSVTQLLNYHRCPRQYYFDRVLHTPSEDEVAVWNNADAPEPPANLTATLRGAVIHRFCEEFREGDDIHSCLKASFEYVLLQRAAQLGDRVSEIDTEKALHDLLPLAQRYDRSNVRQRIEAARTVTHHLSLIAHHLPLGVLSEQRFRIRRPLGILTGTIDKLIVCPSADGDGVNVEIIDFKTNRFRGRKPAAGNTLKGDALKRGQLSLDFLQREPAASDRDLLMRAEVEATAVDYQAQMQAYALAARELIPGIANVRVTLHFLDPDVEVSLPDALLGHEVCAKAIDDAMLSIIDSSSPENFPPRPAEHCRACSFVELCPMGRRWLAA